MKSKKVQKFGTSVHRGFGGSTNVLLLGTIVTLLHRNRLDLLKHGYSRIVFTVGNILKANPFLKNGFSLAKQTGFASQVRQRKEMGACIFKNDFVQRKIFSNI